MVRNFCTDGTEIWPVKPDGTEGRWRWKKENVPTNLDQLEFIQKDGRWEIYVKQFQEENPSRPPATLWLNEEVGHNHEAKLEVRAFNSSDVFSTPKPERFLKRVLEIATNPNDLILDSFAGSGTTGAVAHKMGRRWIMIELGEHCHTHIIPRLQKVIDGQDAGGITESVQWQGGGGFRYYRLAPTLIVNDRWGNPIINPAYNAAQLAEALSKLEALPMRPPMCIGGSMAVPVSVTLFMSPRKTCPPSNCRRCLTRWAGRKACWSVARLFMG